MMDARQGARAALNTMAVELRMVAGGGLTGATPTRVAVNSPYAWGVACGRDGAETVVSLVPSDSMMSATAVPAGVAIRDGAGGYFY
ncbi:MAG: hypothetical protein GWN73_15265, partial [Actinobacteria bacterium]|nr:hypothetical protein [Actinomycetota bacterium]NIW28499.1 hypothetical protein [Actinomycetota bacterium]